MAVNRYYSNTAVSTTLSSGINNSVTSMVVGSVSGFPVSFPYTLVIDRATASEELVTVTAAAGTTLTVTRGSDSTTATTHSAGAAVEHVASARDFREPQEHMDSTAAHGATGAVVGTTNTQTLTNKTISVDSNTVSGIAASSFVLSNSSGNVDGAAAQKVIPAGAVVGTSDTQTLTNKTISGASNTLSAIPSSAVTGLDTHTAATAAHGATGAVVGTTNAQTLSSKTLASPVLSGTMTGGGGISVSGGITATSSTIGLIDGAREIILGYNGSGGLSIGNSTPDTHPNGAVLWFNGINLICRKPGGGDVTIA